MPAPNPYEMDMLRAQRTSDLRQMRDVAEMGAAELESYGGEGAQWAARLRNNPRAALAMAESMGGFGAVTERIRRSAVAGASAQGRAMDPIQLEAWRNSGAAGVNSLAAAGANDSLSHQRETTAQLMNRALGLTEDGEGDSPFGAPTGPGATAGNMSLDTLSALSFAMPEAARSLLAIRKAARDPYSDQLKTIQAVAKPTIQLANTTASNWSYFRGMDFTNPANDAALTKLFMQGVEPGLQVTTSEGQTVIDAATSDVGAIGQRVLRTLTEAGTFTDKTRRMMVEAIDNGFRNRSQPLLEILTGLEEEAQSFFGFGPDEQKFLQRSLVGDDAARTRLQGYLDNPMDFDAIAPPWTDADVPKPKKENIFTDENGVEKIRVGDAVFEVKYDEDGTRWYDDGT